MYGLYRIEADKESSEKMLSTEGAHSQIFRKNFKYVIAATIYTGTVNLDQHQWIERKK